MKLKILSSSSKGNCYILEGKQDKLLVECGISFTEIKKELGFNLSNVRGCLISHEHKDHCKSITNVLNAGIDAYLSNGTLNALAIKHHRANVIKSKVQFNIGEFIILPFDTKHDAKEPLGFLIQCNNEKLLFATDTYYIKYKFKGLNYIMIECNYSNKILSNNMKNGSIPKNLSDRLIQSHFELSNVKDFLRANDLSKVRKIILLHLSDSNSNAEQFKTEIQQLTGIETIIADKQGLELSMYPF